MIKLNNKQLINELCSLCVILNLDMSDVYKSDT